ncbi:hypothetical protein V6N11_069467 [Hibiscus sabdariffa]
MVYHSSFVDEEGITKACGFPLLPLKSHIRGPAPVSDQGKTDIVDEAITFFRANVFFRNFDIKSPADKLLIYLTFYINVALKRLEGCRTLAEGTKAIINLGLEDVPVPGESGFPFPGLFVLPQSQKEAELLRNYLKQIREETSGRLLSVAYRPNGTPNKWWLQKLMKAWDSKVLELPLAVGISLVPYVTCVPDSQVLVLHKFHSCSWLYISRSDASEASITLNSSCVSFIASLEAQPIVLSKTLSYSYLFLQSGGQMCKSPR